MVTDSLRAYGKVAADNNLTHVMIPKNRHTNGGFNIQTANVEISNSRVFVLPQA